MIYPSIKEALERLGSGNVVATLRAKNVRGKRGCFLNCPVALFLCAETTIHKGIVVVGTDHAYTRFDGEIPLPSAVAEFVRAFDRGAYPDLEAPAKGAAP